MTSAAEETIWKGHPSYWNWWVELFLALALALLAAVLWWDNQPRFAPVALACAALLHAGVAIKRRSKLYQITSQRVMAQTGLLAKRVNEVELKDIRTINLEQSLFHRLVGVGDVQMSSAGGEGIEVSFSGIPHAESVKERVRETRLAAQAGGRKNDGE